MSIIFNQTTIEDINCNNTPLDCVMLDNKVVWERQTAPTLLYYTGIDKNGNLEFQGDYDGIPVAYAVGKGTTRYQYVKYNLVEPTPTTASGYSGKYVFDTTNNKYVMPTISNDTITSPSGIIVGETPCYTSETVSLDTKIDNPLYVFNSEIYSYKENNALNPDYFPDIDLNAVYSSSQSVPDIGISSIEIPSTFKGKPITRILKNAFVAAFFNESQDEYLITYNIQNFVLGENIEDIDKQGFMYICRVTEDPQTRSFVLNNKLKTLKEGSLYNIFSSSSKTDTNASVTLPQSVKSIVANSLNNLYLTYRGWCMNKVVITSPEINLIEDINKYGLGDQSNYLVFESTVKKVTGTLRGQSTDSVKACLVFKHGVNENITLDIASPKSALNCVIYTDCEAVKNYDWANKNYTVEFKPLSEFVEE